MNANARTLTTDLTTRPRAALGVGLLLALAGCVSAEARNRECEHFLSVARTAAESTAAWGTVPLTNNGYNCFERLRAGRGQ